MENTIDVGHPFFFPTQVIMVDDDPDFLDGISLMLDKNTSYKLFQSASEALDYANQSHKQVSLQERCYSNYKTGPQDSDSLSHVDIGRLYEEIYNGDRFQTSSTVVVDYSMPEMNGLEFLMELKNPFIKKVLLTGQADTELAIKAFNKQLIDQYIDKHDPRLKQVLNSTISVFSEQYFRSSYKLITDPIIASHHDTFLTDAKFQEYFYDLRLKTQCMEYYMIDHPHTGYLMVDRKGRKRGLIVYREDALSEHIADLKQWKAPANLINEVIQKNLIPAFNGSEEVLNAEHPFIKQWERYYHPAIKIKSAKNYFVAMLTEEDLPQCYQGQVISYADFIENNSLNREILH
jgi:CheY-like chemotaxis protein